MRIGLLGGSFNPAHEGHEYIAREALKYLNLNQIWWIPSPQNPLKSQQDMTEYKYRAASAAHFTAQHPKMRLCELEQQRGLRYSADTVRYLQRRYPQHRFVWLMGADNLAHFHRWHRWQDLFESLPFAVFSRDPQHHEVLRSITALRYRAKRLPMHAAASLADAPAPCWVFMALATHSQSATALRKTLGDKAFLPYIKA